MRTPHTSTFKGKTVHIILRDGTTVVDKFLDKKSGTIILENYGKLPVSQVRSFSPRKLKD
jgi:hypothetical protein